MEHDQAPHHGLVSYPMPPSDAPPHPPGPGHFPVDPNGPSAMVHASRGPVPQLNHPAQANGSSIPPPGTVPLPGNGHFQPNS